ncbi:LppD family lipoprotein [Mycoplasmopsis californica HAZ160_1]|uniref:LppD family lipoprotein n=1 Tax=Mycoplasmopsis californica HAZ160_1 TaxID=1397850 RepID=A0AAT9F8F0_9BACT|nr:hypothetical protein [Mycoplasmopsis californica]BAP01185.1 LppD family lipoprotein [Mycoplasmopsis californica HAZ160_1]BBG41054.1 LppD family lipoprotein [Mycoplasmopsis californica]BBG41647.1 LppD family lipoprotein [Mycoplasmopsis californica]BBG42241.1 LppD family lipoprotein [Mycoplasmopsis californica]BBG42820.1 LppD family lipoprotein [Mycoplasmopsis californica]
MKKKIILTLTTSVFGILPITLAASCQSENKKPEPNPSLAQPTPHKNKIDPSIEKKFKDANNVFELSFKNNKTKADYTAQGFAKAKNDIIIKLKPNIASEYDVQLSSVSSNNDNSSGVGALTLLFTNKKNKNIQHYFTYIIKGLKKSNINDDGTVPDRNQNKDANWYKNYLGASQEQRYKLDNDEYDKFLIQQYLAHGKTVATARPELEYTNEKAQKFNQKATKVNLPSYDSSIFKGFTVPKLKSDGTVEGLAIQPDRTLPSDFSQTDFLEKKNPYKSVGLARLLPNQKYIDIAKQTISVYFSYWDTFDKEINPRKQYIERLKGSDKDKALKEYQNELIEPLDKRIIDLKLEFDFEYKRNAEVNKPLIKKTYDEKIASVQQEINEIKAYSHQQAIERLEKEIKEFEAKISEKRSRRRAAGTMWILDYEIPKNGGYPTKWYFGTNSHVARIMATSKFTGMEMTFMDKPVGVLTKLKLTSLDPHFTTYGWGGDKIKEAVTRVFDATDYLTSSPKDYLIGEQKEKYKNVEEMADFAVIEVDFAKLAELSTSSNDLTFGATKEQKTIENVSKDAQDMAKAVTNDYYSLPAEKKIKFLSTSYLRDYDKIDYQLAVKNGKTPKKTDQLFALGYPRGDEDFFFRRDVDDEQNKIKKTSHSLWINSDYEFYDAKPQSEGGQPSISKEKLDKGDYLSYNLSFRTFTNKPGINDGFIANPIVAKDIYDTYDKDGETLKQYFNSGLQYMLRRFVPFGGASGSSVRNQNNELVGILHSVYPKAKTSVIAAFRSEGYNYQGAYGNYNLPQYDLIYGGGKDQKNSYRQALKAKYAEGIKTYLFENGIEDNNVPQQFKFQN